MLGSVAEGAGVSPEIESESWFSPCSSSCSVLLFVYFNLYWTYSYWNTCLEAFRSRLMTRGGALILTRGASEVEQAAALVSTRASNKHGMVRETLLSTTIPISEL